MRFSLTPNSANRKTGPIATSIISEDSCPSACPLKKAGCYAKVGPILIHWKRLNKVGLTFAELLVEIKNLAKGKMFRYGVAGDLPGVGNKVNIKALQELTKAVGHINAFAYTHKPVGKKYPENTKAIQEANKAGFTINLSADNLKEADELADLNIAPVVVVLPLGTVKTVFTPAGRKVIQCPAQYIDRMTCEKCRLCTKQRSVIVGFEAHGGRAKMASAVAAN